MRELSAEIEIAAPPELVWDILVDFSRFPEWNPFIRKAEGEMKEGRRIKMRIEPPGGVAITLKPWVERVVEHREFRWLGRFLFRGLFDGRHSFEILPTGDGKVRLVQHETFQGILVPLFWRSFKGPAKQGFEDMNKTLKERAEKLFADRENTST